MRCQFCGSWNADEEQHCELCGRPPSGREPPRRVRSSADALSARAGELPLGIPPGGRSAGRRAQAAAARPPLPAGKVIPFEAIAPARLPARAEPGGRPERKPQARPATARPAAPRHRAAVNQPSLPFPPPPAPPTPAVWREVRVAPVGVRCASALVNGLLILAGFGVFLLTFRVVVGRIVWAPKAALAWGAVLATLALFHGVYWCVLGRDSPGMRHFGLRLLDFDGNEPEPSQRVVRLMAACMSLLAGGLGLLWAVVDEERLTWHDHISKTFPTLDDRPPARGRR